MDNTITVNGKTYRFPCSVTGEEARAIRDAAPPGMLEVVDPYNGRWQQDLSCFNFASDEYQFRISPDWNLEEAPATMNEPAPKFPLTPAEAFRALANGECVEMAGLIHRLKDRLEWWTTEWNEWELASISTYDFHNMRIVQDPSVREIRLATGQRVRIDGDDVHLLDGDGESVFCLMRDEMKEILNAMEGTHND